LLEKLAAMSVAMFFVSVAAPRGFNDEEKRSMCAMWETAGSPR
jgi:hypothetical protein